MVKPQFKFQKTQTTCEEMRAMGARDFSFVALVMVAFASIHLLSHTSSEMVMRPTLLPAPSTPALRSRSVFGSSALFTYRLRGGGAKRPKYESESEEMSISESDEDEEESSSTSSESYDEDDKDDVSSDSAEEPRSKKGRHSRSKTHKRSTKESTKDSRVKSDKHKADSDVDSMSDSEDESSSSRSDIDAQRSSESSLSEVSDESETDDEESDEVTSSSMEDTLRDFASPDGQNRLDAQRMLSLKDGRSVENRELTGEKREIAESPSGKILHLPCPGYAESLLEGLKSLRHDKSTCDIILVASDGRSEFAAHRAVISAVSPELKSLIEHSQSNKISLADTDAHSLDLLLNFIYTGKAQVLEENLPSLLGICENLGVQGLRDTCAEHLLRELTVQNAIRFRALGQNIHCTEVFEAAHHLIMDEFPSVCKTPSFLELDASVLGEIVGSDDLAVESEEEVFDSIIRWVEHDEANRKTSLLALLGKVRLGLMDLDVLAKRVAASPLVQKYVAQDPSFQAMLNSAITFVGSQGETKARLGGPQTKLRTGSRGRYMVCLGGRKGGSSDAQHNVWMLDRVHYDWYELEPMISARKQLAAAELGGKLFVCGGWDGSQYLRSVEMYEPGARSWTKSSLMQVARGSFGLATMDNQIWAAGGYDGLRHLASVERFNATSQSWVAAAPLITARSGLRLALLTTTDDSASTLYAVGGFDGHSVLSNVERYDPSTESWKQCAPMLQLRRDFALASLDGFLYAAGGFDGVNDLASVERYDPIRNEWKAVANMTQPRSGFGIVGLNGKLHAVGGYDGKSYLSSAEVFDHKSNSWCMSVEAALPERMAHFAITLL